MHACTEDVLPYPHFATCVWYMEINMYMHVPQQVYVPKMKVWYHTVRTSNSSVLHLICVLHCTFASLLQIVEMPPQKKCPNCNICKYCNVDIKKKRGRPVGTTKSAGYRVGTNGGRPRKTTTSDSSSCVARGRPMGSTESNLFCVGKSGGRPTGTVNPEIFVVEIFS
jgi:hypothetical protein